MQRVARTIVSVIVSMIVCSPIAATPGELGNLPPANRVIASAYRGSARAQTVLGFMYETGRGVPQNFESAVVWYSRAAEQGEPTAQHLLGLMYDKGQGVPQDEILAHKWLNLAAAKATGRQHEYYARIRDAVAFKLNTEQISAAQALADGWRPIRER